MPLVPDLLTRGDILPFFRDMFVLQMDYQFLHGRDWVPGYVFVCSAHITPTGGGTLNYRPMFYPDVPSNISSDRFRFDTITLTEGQVLAGPGGRPLGLIALSPGPDLSHVHSVLIDRY